MSRFERYLTVWVGLCIVAGIGLGHLAPAAFQAIGSMEVAKVNLPVALLIWLMIVPMLVKVDFAALGRVAGHWRGIGVTLFINWGVKPFSMAALGWLFVSEGSKLGAAFLIKRAVGLGLSESFGARHLGEPAGGRAEGWKNFVRTLDGLAFSAEEEAAVDKGAIDAFNRFTVLLEQAYATAPEMA